MYRHLAYAAFISLAYFVLLIWGWLVKLPTSKLLYTWPDFAFLLVQPMALYVFLKREVDLAADQSRPYGYNQGLRTALFASLLAVAGVGLGVLAFDTLVFPQRIEALRYQAFYKSGGATLANEHLRKSIDFWTSEWVHAGIMAFCAGTFFLLNSTLLPFWVRNEQPE